MQAILEVKQLQDAVKQAGKFATSKHMPILNTVRIEAGADGLTVTGTNLETWARSTVECVTQTDSGPSSVLVSASLLAKLAGKLGKGEVLLMAPKAVDGKSGVLTIGGAVIPTMEIEEYPETPRTAAGVLVGSFPGAVFKDLVKRLKAASKTMSGGAATAYAAATGQFRRNLTGINTIYGAGRVKFAATDGHRLLLEEFDTDCNESGAVLVDAAELARIATLVKASDVVTLEAIAGDPARLVVSFSSARYTLRDIPETFPDFERVIPKAHAVEFTVSRKSLLEAVRRGGIVASRDSGAVTLSLTAGSSVLSMSSGCRDLGSYSESVRLGETVEDPGEPVSFNGSYIEDVLKGGKSLSVRVSLGGRLQAALFSTDSDSVPGRTRQAWVLMPVNVE